MRSIRRCQVLEEFLTLPGILFLISHLDRTPITYAVKLLEIYPSDFLSRFDFVFSGLFSTFVVLVLLYLHSTALTQAQHHHVKVE